MDLDRLAVTLRPRTEWEAVDLGFAMVRTWARPVYAAWLALTLPAAATLILLFGGWGFLAFWWLLPLFEATTLKVLSQTVFGEAPATRRALREAPAEWRRFLNDATWRRLDVRRSFHMPVTALERSTGAERRKRLKVLSSRTSDAAAWLGFVFWAFAAGLAAATIAALVMLTPPWLGIDWGLLSDRIDAGEAPGATKGLFAIWALMVIAVDPFYTACGFCLYLSRRTALEGWDLEIAFRSIARRIRGPERRASGPAAGAVLGPVLAGAWVVAAALGAPAAVHGQEEAAATAADRTPAEVVAEVMARDELRTDFETERWQLRSDLEWLGGWRDGQESAGFDPSFFRDLTGVAAQFVEALLWLGLGILLLVVLREVWRGAPAFKVPGARESDGGPPERIAGLDVRRESLPPDVAAVALAWWREGRPLEALGLLYRGALSRLHGEGLELRESYTEADCLTVASKFLATDRTRPGGGRAGHFEALTRAWQMAAYAHRLPSDAEAEALVASWRSSFETTAAPAGSAA
ncbi:MAG: DUF4129 domain-containing protein [Acidobacteriota bacterium]